MTTGLGAIVMAIFAPILIFLRITRGQEAAEDYMMNVMGPFVWNTLDKIFNG